MKRKNNETPTKGRRSIEVIVGGAAGFMVTLAILYAISIIPNIAGPLIISGMVGGGVGAVIWLIRDEN